MNRAAKLGIIVRVADAMSNKLGPISRANGDGEILYVDLSSRLTADETITAVAQPVEVGGGLKLTLSDQAVLTTSLKTPDNKRLPVNQSFFFRATATVNATADEEIQVRVQYTKSGTGLTQTVGLIIEVKDGP